MEEFDSNHQSLQEMDELIEMYKQSNKFEAAKRLEQQMELLKSRFDTCKHKFKKFTSPQSGFESRLNRAMGELRNIERSSIVLDISSGEWKVLLLSSFNKIIIALHLSSQSLVCR